MKTNKLIKRLGLGVMLVFISAAAFAGEGDKPTGKVSIHPYLDTEFSIVSVSNVTDKNAVFSIKDENGLTVYKEWVNKAGIEQKILDFSRIDDGVYTAVLKAKGLKDVSKTFVILNHQLSSETEETKLSNNQLKSFFHLNDNTLTVSHISFGSKSFDVSISDAIGENLYAESFSGNSTFSHKYDVSSLPSGDYTVSINSGNKEYSYAFRK